MKASILTVGVAVIDFVMTVDEMPRRPEKYRANDAAIVGGGCGANAAVAIARLGGDCTLAARLGDDQVADLIISGLQKDEIDCQLVRRFPGCRSSFSSIFIDRLGERQIVNYRDESLPVDAGWLSDGGQGFDAVLADNRWTEGAMTAMEMARKSGKPGVLDAEAPIRNTEPAMQVASHVVFSAQGLREYAVCEDLPTGLEIAQSRLGDFVAVTDGPAGVWWRNQKSARHVPGFAVEALDTLGAGDVWHGAFTLALGEQMPIEQGIVFANAAAAIKCTKPGGREGSPFRNQVTTFLGNNSKCI